MAEDGQQVQTSQEEQNGGVQQTQQGGDDGLPKTQAELDALIEKRLARERKKLARQNAQQTGAQQEGGTDPGQQAADAAAQAALGRELLIARAQLDAYREGVTAAAVEDAVLLAVMQAETVGGPPLSHGEAVTAPPEGEPRVRRKVGGILRRVAPQDDKYYFERMM